MSKTIKYITCVRVNIGTGENASIKETFIPTSMPYSEANEEIAKREAYNGEYTIEDDGQPEPEPKASTDEVLNILLGVTV
jgi:hypothetical protein